jgi:hypothetical protein
MAETKKAVRFLTAFLLTPDNFITGCLIWRPQGDSNPCYRRERAVCVSSRVTPDFFQVGCGVAQAVNNAADIMVE